MIRTALARIRPEQNEFEQVLSNAKSDKEITLEKYNSLLELKRWLESNNHIFGHYIFLLKLCFHKKMST